MKQIFALVAALLLQSCMSSNCVDSKQSLDGLQNQLEGQQNQLEGQQNQLEGQQNQLKGLKNQLQSLQTKLQSLQSQSEDQQRQLESLQRNPVPIGFVYVQLSNQPQPLSLWPQTEWENISSTYAGLFFRVFGGNSAAFGATQNENAPRISEIKNIVDPGTIHHINIPANDDWSLPLWTGSDMWNISPEKPCYWATLFRQSAGEVRPRNQAVQIWKRIK